MTFRIALLTAACLCAAFAGPSAFAEDAKQPEVPFLGGFLRESHVLYPLEQGDWKMRDEHRYDAQEAGVSVRFSRDDDKTGWIDVFFYPVGVLDAAAVERMAEAEKQELVAAWGSAMQDPKDITALSKFDVARPDDKDGKDPIVARSLDFAFERDGAMRSSAMVFAVDRMYAIKFRYTALQEKVSREKARSDLDAFARGFLPRLDIESTGQCWNPAPIEGLAKGAPAPKDAMITTSEDGTPSVWLLSDRVVARDPDGPGAKVMQILGMAMQERLYKGCTGADPIQPTVPKGMREVRFENKAPGVEQSPSERPIRVGRSGLG